MMRLPHFRYLAPRRIDETVDILSGEGPHAMPMAGVEALASFMESFR